MQLIAGSLGAGLMAAQEGAMVKNSGRAAQAGVKLSAKNFTGIQNIVEADYGGFLSSFSGKNDFNRSIRNLYKNV